MQVMKGRFTAVIEPAEEGGFRAYCPEIAIANGQGDTAEEAEAKLHEAIQVVLDSQALDEAAWVFEAAVLKIAKPESIVAWADEKIMQLDQPPYWLIELSTLKSLDPEDYASIIKPQLREALTISRKISLIASAIDHGLFEPDEARSALFQEWVLAPREDSRGFPEPIADLLVEWDSLDEMRDDFETRFQAALGDHLRTHGHGSERPYLIASLPSSC